jgi:hypothetical protein
MPDGTVRPDVHVDVETLRELSRVARADGGMAGAVQHGASTLPPEAFDAFPSAGTCEIHLATDFQNIVYEHAQFPRELKDEMYRWVRTNATEERKPHDTDEQFIYRARKRALGPFKRQLWDSTRRRARDRHGARARFRFLMTRLRVNDTAPSSTGRHACGRAQTERQSRMLAQLMRTGVLAIAVASSACAHGYAARGLVLATDPHARNDHDLRRDRD